MLIYLLLVGAPRASLTVRPVGSNIGAREREKGAAAVMLLDRDESTASLRRDMTDSPSARRIRDAGGIDMLTTRVPGTDMEVGLSRQLFAACRELAPEQRAMALSAAHDATQNLGATEPYLDEIRIARGVEGVAETDLPEHGIRHPAPETWRREASEDRLNEQERFLFRRAESERWQTLLGRSRRGFAIGAEASWQELTEAEPEVTITPRTPMLESATADVYIAIAHSAVP